MAKEIAAGTADSEFPVAKSLIRLSAATKILVLSEQSLDFEKCL
jgi:hypothetical protein